MHAPWIAQITGLGISSARFQASMQPTPEGTQPLRRLGDRGQRAEVHAGGEHRAGAAQHHAAHAGVVAAAARSAALAASTSSLVERVALLGAVQDDVADRAAVFDQDELAHGLAPSRGVT